RELVGSCFVAVVKKSRSSSAIRGSYYPLAMATDPARTYPSELSALALRETVVFPLSLQPLAIPRPISIESVNRALASDRLIFLSLQTTDSDDPTPNDLNPIGTIAAIRQMVNAPSGRAHVIA